VSILAGLRQAVLDASENLMNAALAECRRATAEASPTPETGDLARSIVTDPANVSGETLTSTIRATAQHASYTDEGTGIYVGRGRITARRPGGVLRFYWITGPDGPGEYFFRSVAGQPGQHWFAQPMGDRWEASLDWASRAGAFRA